MPSRGVARIGSLALAVALVAPAVAEGHDDSAPPTAVPTAVPTAADPGERLSTAAQSLLGPQRLGTTLHTALVLGALSLAPAVLMMTTSFVRIAIVLGLLRQALGGAQLPPAQVTTSLALFLTLAVMAPVWQQVYDEAIAPYSQEQITLDQAWQRGSTPVRRFMAAQIERTGNTDEVWLFYDRLPTLPTPQSYDDIPFHVLLPAFVLSELKTAFLLGFQIYLPLLVIDLVVAAVTVSLGMWMLPPALVSLPFKLLLFVLVDGWRLVVGMLLDSFTTPT